MNQSLSFLKPLTLIAVLLLPAAMLFAQAPDNQRPEPNFDITLQLLVSSPDGRSDVPDQLKDVSRQIRAGFQNSNLKLVSTYLGRVGNNGTIEYKSVGDIFGTAAEGQRGVFQDWSIVSLRSLENTLTAQSFRFGARIPIELSSTNEAGKQTSSTVYEDVGLKFQRIGFTVGVPTLLGTLTLPKTNGTLFLVITAARTDR